MSRQLAQRAEQFVLVRVGLLLQLLEAIAGHFFGTKLFQLDAVVIPVEFLAQVADPPHQLALPGVPHRKTLPALEYQFTHAARFRGFHPTERLGRGDFSIGRTEIQGQQRFIDLQTVLHEGNLQFVATQVAAERL